ncbi:MAG: hypothetical protein JWQ04_392, partial [Pedosphaera sp.]|nr:hypothetical protein [Pedosphaera sp.]
MMNPASFASAAGAGISPALQDFSRAPRPDQPGQKPNHSEDFFNLISRTQHDSADKDKSSPPSQDDSTKPANDDPTMANNLLALMAQAGMVVTPKPIQPLPKAGEGASAVVTDLMNGENIEHRTGNSPSPSPIEEKGQATKAAQAAEGTKSTEKSLTVPPGGKAGTPGLTMDGAGRDGKLNPADNAGPSLEEMAPGKLVESHSQLIDKQVSVTEMEGAASTVSPSGTGVALNNQRMKSAADKNEIAGRTVQKLPRAPRSEAVSTETAAKPVAGLDADRSGGKQETLDPTLVKDAMVNPAALDVTQGRGVENSQPVDRSAAQAEHIAHLVDREVMMIRQSGATSLAVSLKLDPHTELFLQLTNHNGQVQALLRCERGNVAGLDHHWGDLQESLARQNVQLLPLANKLSAAPTFVPSISTASSPFNQSS